MTASGRAKVLKAFSTELAIMVKLRSPRIVQVFGVVTTDASYLGLVVEMCAGGTLREALEADDYATAVDEAQRRRWLRRAARNRHRHAIEQASRRRRGGRRDDSARTRRKIMISAQVFIMPTTPST